MEKLIITLTLSGASAALLTLCSLKMLQMYQLSSYRAGGFFKWLARSKGDYAIRYFALAFFQFVSLIIFNFSFSRSPLPYLTYLGLILYVALGVMFVVLQKKQKQKTPLKFTSRIIRQIILLAVVYCGLCFTAVYFVFDYALGYALLGVMAFLIPLCVTFTHFLALPVEILINRHYFIKARRRLSAGMIKIGITGSYGKTTAKNILCTFLSKKYKVVGTPASINTPMGICKLVNGGGLTDCEIFVAEMGARRRGDIKTLCKLVNPDHGIITAVGSQHLETFKTIEAVTVTKLELARGAKGFVVVNSGDNRLCEGVLALLDEIGGEGKTEKERFLYAGIGGTDARFEDVALGAEGTQFTLVIGDEGVEITTPLLSRHVPPLIASCALLAHKLGVSLTDIQAAAVELQPVPHRLQLIKTGANIVIDDAYNSNPEGAKDALEVLGCFAGAKLVITPGFVELGAEEAGENLKLGGNIAKTADFLISVNNAEVFRGAAEAGMDPDCCFVEKSLDGAMERLAALKLERATVLFLNDLPDNY
ncbi:MAG: UDP-N-acetylmuramoyl-tripeptide--D-alanyl-D-alanine ligase [Firmicutes bacterium]|nr:UDP-N-acetylmuramoyl-tripeptide--D-alanyl-D-alanine ligase [Bacillota bacterium]